MQENSLPKSSHTEQQGSNTTTTKQVANVGTDRKPALVAGLQPPEQSLNCPRCDSPNTKFCYYNNYSLTQPRHFCKTCRRYWTKGGALRNVPIGGGCRKNKRSKSSQRNTDEPKVLPESVGKYFPAMDFGLPFSRLQSSQPGFFNHLFSVGGLSSSCSPISSSSPHVIDSSPPVSLLGFNYLTKHGESNGGFPCLGSQSSHSSLASSIESLSTINADLHWKLQQQRLGMFFSGENQKETGISGGDSVTPQHSSLIHAGLLDYQEQQPISFQNLDTSKNGDSGNNSRKSSVHDTGLIRESTTEWLFDNSYVTTTTAAANNTTTNTTTNNWNGLQAWTDFQQYSALN